MDGKEKKQSSFFNELKEVFTNRIASGIIIIVSSVLGAVVAYLGGALYFQSTASQRLTNVEAAQVRDQGDIATIKEDIEQIKVEQKLQTQKIDELKEEGNETNSTVKDIYNLLISQ